MCGLTKGLQRGDKDKREARKEGLGTRARHADMRDMSAPPSPLSPADRTGQILALLHAAFAPEVLELVDESARHAGHVGASPEGQTHFRLLLVSARFAGMARVARARLVHATLAPVLAEGLHALAMTLRTPEEQHLSRGTVPEKLRTKEPGTIAPEATSL